MYQETHLGQLEMLPSIASSGASVFGSIFGGGGGESDAQKFIRRSTAIGRISEVALSLSVLPFIDLMTDQNRLPQIAAMIENYMGAGISKAGGLGGVVSPRIVIEAIQSGGHEFARAVFDRIASLTAVEVGGSGWNGKRKMWGRLREAAEEALQSLSKRPVPARLQAGVVGSFGNGSGLSMTTWVLIVVGGGLVLGRLTR